jgi:hypothetical protein
VSDREGVLMRLAGRRAGAYGSNCLLCEALSGTGRRAGLWRSRRGVVERAVPRGDWLAGCRADIGMACSELSLSHQNKGPAMAARWSRMWEQSRGS